MNYLPCQLSLSKLSQKRGNDFSLNLILFNRTTPILVSKIKP